MVRGEKHQGMYTVKAVPERVLIAQSRDSIEHWSKARMPFGPRRAG